LEYLKVDRNGEARSEGALNSHFDPLPKRTIYVFAYTPIFAARLSTVSP
jgi:hypothetical protein